jgi:hypothetical protein
MNHIRRPLLILSLCTFVAAIACDSSPASSEQLALAPEVAEAVFWPAPGSSSAGERPAVRELAQASDPAAKKPSKFKHRVATETEAIRWVQWGLSQPWTTGPINDTDGSSCAWGQSGKVWHLAGTAGGPVERECDIPKNKDLVFPLINWWAIFFPENFPDEASIEEYMPVCYDWLAEREQYLCSRTLRVDGVDLFAGDPDPDLFRITEERFPVVLDADHPSAWKGYAGGPMSALTSGEYVHLKALKPGDHVLELGGAACFEGEVFFETYAKYNLHVGD